MANILDKFKKNVIGSNSKIADYTCTISPSGDFKRIHDFTAILNNWNNILLTPVGSYDHDPEYGSNLHKYVYEPVDNDTVEGIKNEIRRCITSYNDQADISRIDVKFLKDNKGFSFDIIAYLNDQEGSITITIDESSSFKII